MSYRAAAIEAAWQRRWDEAGLTAARREPGRPKYYVYNPAPYLTGSLHMGHVRNYAMGDFVARLMRLRGANVLYTIGFDAFGLPTEMAAIRNGVSPADWSRDCRAAMETQLRRLGLAIDWQRAFVTSDVSYYRWTQWIFLALRDADFIYSTEAATGWCGRCETALARSQIVDGRCWRCDEPVGERRTREWRLRVGPFLDALEDGLGEIHDWNGLATEGQRLLIGRESGFAVDLAIRPGDARVTAYLAAPDEWVQPLALHVDARDDETLAALGLAGRSPGSRDEPVAACAIEPVSGREFPIVIVSARDTLFADQPRLAPRAGDTSRAGVGGAGAANTEPPPPLRALTINRQKDFSISRERFWGTPIPVVLCPACGEVPLRPEDLPVLAPRVVFDRAAGALAHEDPSWSRRDCPRCGGPAALDPLVMDCHVDSLWHYYRPCAAVRQDEGGAGAFLFDPEEVAYWMPVDAILFGRDVIPFMLDLRLFTHFLHRTGRVPFREFCRETLAHGLVLHGGRKMSKHLGNTVQPEEAMERFGADSLRFYVLASADPRSDCDWSEGGLRRYHEILTAFHGMLIAWSARERPDDRGATAAGGREGAAEAVPAARGVPSVGRYTRVFLGKVAHQETLLAKGAAEMRFDHYAAALAHLLDAMVFFWNTHFARERDAGFPELWRDIVRDSLLYLAPVAPHLAEEGWRLAGGVDSIFDHGRFPDGARPPLRVPAATEVS